MREALEKIMKLEPTDTVLAARTIARKALADRPDAIGEIRNDPHGGWYVQWLVDIGALPKPAILYTSTPAPAAHQK